MGLDMNSITEQMNQGLDKVSDDIATQTNQASGQEMSEQDLLQMQMSMNNYSVMITMQTNIQKAWGDALKAIANNIH